MLEFEERNGKVSKGLKPEQIRGMKEYVWGSNRDTVEDTCTICYDVFKYGERFKKTKCGHEFHSKCLDKWLAEQKRCPMCNEEAI